MELKIRKTTNGFIFTYVDVVTGRNGVGTEVARERVFEEPAGENKERKLMKEMMAWIADYFDINYTLEKKREEKVDNTETK